MLMPTAGARIYVARLYGGGVSAASLTGLIWTEVSETEALGTLGGKWSLIDVTTEEESLNFVKDVQEASFMQILLGNDLADPGQLVLLEAYRNREERYAFRIDFPLMAGQSTPARRIWAGLVTTFEEVFDTANGVIKTLVELIPQSETVRIEAT